MAVANLDTNKQVGKYNDIKALTFTTLDATAGGEYTVKANDSKTIIIIKNNDSSNAETVTIKSPANGALGKGSDLPDKAVSVAAGTMAVALVESTKYMDSVSKKVTLAGSADVSVVVVEVE